ncbi:MAG: Hsp20 family protein [Bryobacteraceae bacterium]
MRAAEGVRRHTGSDPFSLSPPQGAKTEQAKAHFINGVLEIAVPVPKEASKRREIPVTAGGQSASAAAGKK